MKRISVREANQQFSRCIARVQTGETIEITKRGELVARIVPAKKRRSRSADVRERNELIRLMDANESFGLQPWTRDEMHERSK